MNYSSNTVDFIFGSELASGRRQWALVRCAPHIMKIYMKIYAAFRITACVAPSAHRPRVVMRVRIGHFYIKWVWLNVHESYAVVCRSDEPIFNLGRLSKAAYCIFYLTIKDMFLKVHWGLWCLEMCTKFKFENLNLQHLHLLPAFAFSDITNRALMLFALLLPRWTCSPMAWFCTSYWPGKGPHWDTTSYR